MSIIHKDEHFATNKNTYTLTWKQHEIIFLKFPPLLVLFVLKTVIVIHNTSHSEKDFPMEFIKERWIINSPRTNTETTLFAHWGLLFGNEYGYHSLIQSNIYSVQMNLELKIQKDWSTRTNVFARKYCIYRQIHNIGPQNCCGHIKMWQIKYSLKKIYYEISFTILYIIMIYQTNINSPLWIPQNYLLKIILNFL